jgi:hypothetical protein
LIAFFGIPFVATLTGFLLGAGLLFSSKGAYSNVDPDDVTASYLAIIYPMLLRFLIAAAALAVYMLFMSDALVAFSLGLVAGFFIGANVELWKYARARRRALSGKGGW